MHVKLWGTRGSLPKPHNNDSFYESLEYLFSKAKTKSITTLDEFLSEYKNQKEAIPLTHGGNTSCIEVSHKDSSYVVDMGSGFRDYGTMAINEGKKSFDVFLTHLHWDHVMGMPFFIPIFLKGYEINIYHVHKNAPEHVKINFNGVNFPIKWSELGSEINFHQLKLYETINKNDLKITPFSLDHPGGSFGYHFETPSCKLAIGVDGEYKRNTREELGRDLKYFQDLDLLLFDAQYGEDEHQNHYDWGHSTHHIGIDIALREKVRNLVFTHHDPWSDDQKLDKMFQQATVYLGKNLEQYQEIWTEQKNGPNLINAFDGLKIDLD